MPACQPTAASPVDSRFEPIQKTIHRRVVQPVTQLVAIRRRRSQDQQRQDRNVRLTNSIKESLRLADPLHDSPPPASAENGRNGSRSRGSNPSTSNPVAARTYLGRPKLATAAFTVFGEQPTTRCCRRHV